MGKIARLSLKAKLVLLSLFLSAVSITIGAVSFNGIYGIEQSYAKVTDGVMPNLALTNEMFLAFKDVTINMKSLGLPGLSESEAVLYTKKMTEAVAAYDKADEAYLAIPFVEGEQVLYDEKKKQWLIFRKLSERVVAAQRRGSDKDREEKMHIFLVETPKASEDYLAAFTKLRDFNQQNGVTFVQEANDKAKATERLVLAVIAIGVLLGTGLAYVFANAIARTLGQVIERLRESATQVTSASSQIAASSEELSQAASEQAASLEQTAASLEEITAMIGKASGGAVKAAESSANSQKKSEEGQKAVGQMLKSMEDISQSNHEIMVQIDDSNRQMSEIVKVIQEIGVKTQVINDIVFQTKLLSFNASVEAARAGEQGKGFAVVAEEVGNLAQMSGNAAKEISDMLAGSTAKVEMIVQDTKTKVESLIEQGKVRVESGVRVAKECADVLEEIVRDVSEVSSLANEISTASQDQAQGVGEINKAMVQLDSVTQQNSAASEETSQAAQQLAAQAQVLQGAVDQLVNSVQGGAPKGAA